MQILAPPSEGGCLVAYYEGAVVVLREALENLIYEPTPVINHGHRGGYKLWYGREDLEVVREATTWLIEEGEPRMRLLNRDCECRLRVEDLRRLQEAAYISEEDAARRVATAAPALSAATGWHTVRQRQRVECASAHGRCRRPQRSLSVLLLLLCGRMRG